MNYEHITEATIVNKDGKEGMLTFVLDDGIEQSVQNALKILNDNSLDKVKITFAIKTNTLATLKESADGSQYVMNNGKYTYTKLALADTWKERLKNKNIEVVSHTYSHQFHGTNDDGKTFEYVDNSGTVHTSGTFPKGSSTKEIMASKQIIEELLGIQAVTLIHAGIGVKTTDQTVSGKIIKTYKTFFNEVLKKAIADGKMIGSRGTFQAKKEGDLPSKVNTPAMVYERRVTGIFAYMIEYSDDTTLWTKYIEQAMKSGGWA